jgi:hypothetical protein
MRAAYVQFLRRLRPLAALLVVVVIVYAARLAFTASTPPPATPSPDLLCAQDAPCTGAVPDVAVVTVGAAVDLRRFAPIVSVSVHRLDGRPTGPVRLEAGELRTDTLEPGEYQCYIVAQDGTAVSLRITVLAV